MKPYRFLQPPKAIKRAKLANLVLMPASALPFKAQYQRLANVQPEGTVLLCLPKNERQRSIMRHVLTQLRSNGRRVTTIDPHHTP